MRCLLQHSDTLIRYNHFKFPLVYKICLGVVLFDNRFIRAVTKSFATLSTLSCYISAAIGLAYIAALSLTSRNVHVCSFDGGSSSLRSSRESWEPKTAILGGPVTQSLTPSKRTSSSSGPALSSTASDHVSRQPQSQEPTIYLL